MNLCFDHLWEIFEIMPGLSLTFANQVSLVGDVWADSVISLSFQGKEICSVVLWFWRKISAISSLLMECVQLYEVFLSVHMGIKLTFKVCDSIQVAIPVVPTIRVLVTFTKFEELQPLDEFATPPSSPTGRESPAMTTSSTSSWLQWIKAPYQRPSSSFGGSSSRIENVQDPFLIPPDYTWVTAEAKKKKMQEKQRAKRGKNQNRWWCTALGLGTGAKLEVQNRSVLLVHEIQERVIHTIVV